MGGKAGQRRRGVCAQGEREEGGCPQRDERRKRGREAPARPLAARPPLTPRARDADARNKGMVFVWTGFGSEAGRFKRAWTRVERGPRCGFMYGSKGGGGKGEQGGRFRGKKASRVRRKGGVVDRASSRPRKRQQSAEGLKKRNAACRRRTASSPSTEAVAPVALAMPPGIGARGFGGEEKGDL